MSSIPLPRKISSSIDAIRQEKNKALLASIAENGLHASATEVRLRSFESKPCNRLSINLVDLTQSRKRNYQPIGGSATEEDIDNVLKNLIYSTTQGAWPIALERSFTSPNLSYFELDERLANSLLFILKAPDGDRYRRDDKIVSSNFDAPNAASQFLNFTKLVNNEGLFSFELGTQHKFTAENDIVAIICPKQMEEQVKIHFKKVLIVAVEITLQPVKVIVDPKAIFDGTKKFELNGPNYIEGLRRVMAQTKLKRFSCHVTRLLTQRDILNVYKNTLDRKEIIGFYKTADLDHAFRRAAADGHLVEMELLLEYGAKIDGQASKTGKTALHFAVKYNRKFSIAFLLEKGANKSLKDTEEKLDAEALAQQKSVKLYSFSDLERIRQEEQEAHGLVEFNKLAVQYGMPVLTQQKLNEMRKMKEEQEKPKQAAAPAQKKP